MTTFGDFEARPAHDDAASAVFLHQVAPPLDRRIELAALTHENVAVGRRRDAGQAVERLVLNLVEPALAAPTVDRCKTPSGDARD